MREWMGEKGVLHGGGCAARALLAPHVPPMLPPQEAIARSEAYLEPQHRRVFNFMTICARSMRVRDVVLRG